MLDDDFWYSRAMISENSGARPQWFRSPARTARLTASLLMAVCSPLLASEWMEGPDGVLNQIEEEDSKRFESASTGVIRDYTRWKQALKEEWGLSFGVQYLALYQSLQATPSPDVDRGGGGIFRINGSYDVFETDDGYAGWIEWRIENRHNLFWLLAPSEMGELAGIKALNPADSYLGDFDTDLAVINWTQLFSNRWGFTVGRLSYASYLDAGYFQSLFGGFLNAAFIASPALAITGVGALGIAVRGFLTPHLTFGIQAHDANARNGRFSPDTLRQNEYLSAIDMGWTGDPYQHGLDRILLTLWRKDALKKQGIGEGHGLAINGTLQAGNFIPFLHFAVNNGGGGVAARRAASTGVEYVPGERGGWVFGVAWAEPASAGSSRDELVAETSYRLDIMAGFEIMLDLQYIRYTSSRLRGSAGWVGSLRVNLSL